MHAAEGLQELDEGIASVEASICLGDRLPRLSETYSIWLYATLKVKVEWIMCTSYMRGI